MKYKTVRKISNILFKYDLMDLLEVNSLEDEYDLEAELIVKRCRADSVCNAASDIEKIFKECFSGGIKLQDEKLMPLSIEVINILNETKK